jgi:hypothetical protein
MNRVAGATYHFNQLHQSDLAANLLQSNLSDETAIMDTEQQRIKYRFVCIVERTVYKNGFVVWIRCCGNSSRSYLTLSTAALI